MRSWEGSPVAPESNQVYQGTVAVGDLDNDGIADLVFVSSNFEVPTLQPVLRALRGSDFEPLFEVVSDELQFYAPMPLQIWMMTANRRLCWWQHPLIILATLAFNYMTIMETVS